MKRLIAVLISLPLLFFLVGCEDTAPLKEKLIIEGIAVDYANQQFEVTLQVYAPSSDHATKGRYQLFSAEGSTLYQALRLVDENIGKYSYYSDTKVVVFSVESLQQGLWNNLEYFVRSSEMGSNVALAATYGRAADLLEIEGEGVNMPARVLSNALHYGKSDVGPISGELMTVSAMMVNPWAEVSLPVLEVHRKQDKAYPSLNGILCFFREQPAYHLTEQEKWVYNWLHEYYDDRAFVLSFDGHPYALQMREYQRKIDVSVIHGVPMFTVKLTITCDIMETNSPHGVLLTRLDEFKQQLQATVNEMTVTTLQKVVNEQGCDVFDLGRTLQKQQHAYALQTGNLTQALANSRFICQSRVVVARAGQGSVDE